MSVERATPGETDWPELAAPHLARYLFAMEYAAGRRVLDAGTGCGYGARILRQAGAAEVVGIDLDEAALAGARARFGGDGMRFVRGDCERLSEIDGTFDLICSFENIEHLRHPERFLSAAARRLSADGIVLISTPNRDATPPFVNGRPRNPFHVHEWDETGFRQLLQRKFHDVEIRLQTEALSVAAREEAVAALRQGLAWCNPIGAFLWRKWPFARGRSRSWKKLSWLAAPAVGDYPILPASIAALFGRATFFVAVCRDPVLRESRPARGRGAQNGQSANSYEMTVRGR